VVAEMHHQSISCKVFLYGVVRFDDKKPHC
jgi:hypothetical protein